MSQSYFYRATRHSARVVPAILFILNKFVPCHLCLLFHSSLNNPLTDPLAAANPARYLILYNLLTNRRLSTYTQPRYH